MVKNESIKRTKSVFRIFFGALVLLSVNSFEINAAQGSADQQAEIQSPFVFLCIEDVVCPNGDFNLLFLDAGFSDVVQENLQTWKMMIEEEKRDRGAFEASRKGNLRTEKQLLQSKERIQESAKEWLKLTDLASLKKQFPKRIDQIKLLNTVREILVQLIHVRLALVSINAYDFYSEKLPDYGSPQEVQKLFAPNFLCCYFTVAQEEVVKVDDATVNEIGSFYQVLNKLKAHSEKVEEDQKLEFKAKNIFEFLKENQTILQEISSFYKNRNFSLSLRRAYYRLFRALETDLFFSIIAYFERTGSVIKALEENRDSFVKAFPFDLMAEIEVLRKEIGNLKIHSRHPFLIRDAQGDYACADFMCDMYAQNYQLFLQLTQLLDKQPTIIFDGVAFVLPANLYGDFIKSVDVQQQSLAVAANYDDADLLADFGEGVVVSSKKAEKKKAKQPKGHDNVLEKKKTVKKDSLRSTFDTKVSGAAAPSLGTAIQRVILHDRISAWKRFADSRDLCSCEGLVRGGYFGTDPVRSLLFREFIAKYRGDNQAAAREIIENHDLPKTLIDCICNQGQMVTLENGEKYFKTLVFKKSAAGITYYAGDVCSDDKRQSGVHFIYHALLRTIDLLAFMNGAQTSVERVSEFAYPKEIGNEGFTVVGEPESWVVQEDATPWVKVVNPLNDLVYGVLKKTQLTDLHF